MCTVGLSASDLPMIANSQTSLCVSSSNVTIVVLETCAMLKYPESQMSSTRTTPKELLSVQQDVLLVSLVFPDYQVHHHQLEPFPLLREKWVILGPLDAVDTLGQRVKMGDQDCRD